MAQDSKIEWTDHTFNPWIGCTKVSPACAHCYAERDMDHRYGKAKWGPSGTRVLTSPANWKKPVSWNRKAEHSGVRFRVFCSSLADVFESWEGPVSNGMGEVWTKPYLDSDSQRQNWQTAWPEDMNTDPQGWRYVTLDDIRQELFALIDQTPHLDWLLLTKRPENVMRMWPYRHSAVACEHPEAHLPCTNRENVWLGTSIENQRFTDARLPFLHEAKRRGLVRTTFVSAEPLVGPIILQGETAGRVYNHLGSGGLDWVITGGESGPDARLAHSDWYRSLRDQCHASGTPFVFKQWGEWAPGGWGGIHANKPVRFVTIDGHASETHDRWTRDDNPERQTRVGKKSAGRLLDEVEHNEFPAP